MSQQSTEIFSAMNLRFVNRSRQSGSVLAISLVILLVLTILGVNSMSSLMLEEKMAANTRQSMVASQAAEVALRAGEDWIRNNVTAATDISQFSNGTAGLYSHSGKLNPPLGVFTDNTFWTNNGVAVGGIAAIDPAGAKTQSLFQDPRYIIEYLGRVSEDARDDALDIINDVVVDKREYAFRITAIGYGENPNARFLAQSTYRIRL